MPDMKVLLLGDAIRLSYQDRVAEILAEDGLRVIPLDTTTGHSSRCAELVSDLAESHDPDVACFSAGPYAAEDLHNITEDDLIPFGRFECDICRIADILRRYAGRQVAFITTPPIHVDRFASRHPGDDGYDLAFHHRRHIEEYNELAIGLMAEMNIYVTDLYHDLSPHVDEALGEDGVELSESGRRLAAEIVARGVYSLLSA